MSRVAGLGEGFYLRLSVWGMESEANLQMLANFEHFDHYIMQIRIYVALKIQSGTLLKTCYIGERRMKTDNLLTTTLL